MKASRRRLNEEVLGMLEGGHSVKAIVKQTGMAERTVYRKRAAYLRRVSVEGEELQTQLEQAMAALGMPSLEDMLRNLDRMLPPMPTAFELFGPQQCFTCGEPADGIWCAGCLAEVQLPPMPDFPEIG